VERAARAALRAGEDRVRRLICVLAAAACAQPGLPPGGPPDDDPPVLVRVSPDSNARNVRAAGVVFEFDEVVSERPQGAASLADAFLISPSTGPAAVSWRRRSVVVAPRGGWRANTTYTVRLLPGMTDLESNVDSAGRVVVFSTGPEIASAYIRGTVFDWIGARPTIALVQAITLPDSAIFATTSDSVGAFHLPNMPAGRYLLRALVDQNRNRTIDARELFDSVTVELRDSLRREMLAIVRDSLGPGLANVDARDSTTLRVTFDRALDTALVVTPAMFTLKSADSAAWVIRRVLTPRELERIAADSARAARVQDSVRQAALADSIRRADSAAAAGAARPTGRRPGAVTAPPAAAAPDSSRPAPIRPAAQIPINSLVLQLERPLPPRTNFRLRALELRGITGAVRTSDRVFTTPAPRPRPPTRPDTGGRPP
jgi:hypothetical protein